MDRSVAERPFANGERLTSCAPGFRIHPLRDIVLAGMLPMQSVVAQAARVTLQSQAGRRLALDTRRLTRRFQPQIVACGLRVCLQRPEPRFLPHA